MSVGNVPAMWLRTTLAIRDRSRFKTPVTATWWRNPPFRKTAHGTENHHSARQTYCRRHAAPHGDTTAGIQAWVQAFAELALFYRVQIQRLYPNSWGLSLTAGQWRQSHRAKAIKALCSADLSRAAPIHTTWIVLATL